MGSKLLADLYRPGASPEAAAHMARVLRDSAPGEVAAGYLEAIYETDASGLLPEVEAPALVLHYRDDRLIPVRGAGQLAAGLRRCRVVLLEGAYHLPVVHDLPEIVATITDFVAERRPDGRARA